MLYQGEPIDALYHSTCGGITESALESWGKDIPYLRSSNCNYCRQSKHYESIQVFSSGELYKLTGINAEAKKLTRPRPGVSKKLQLDIV